MRIKIFIVSCLFLIGVIASAGTWLKQDFSNRELFPEGISKQTGLVADIGGAWIGLDNRNFAIIPHPDNPDKHVLKIERVTPGVLTVVRNQQVPDGRNMTVRFNIFPGTVGESTCAIRFSNQKSGKIVAVLRLDVERNIIAGIAANKSYFGIRFDEKQWREYVLRFEPNKDKYQISKILDDKTEQKGLEIPYENNLPIDKIEFITYPASRGEKNVVLLDRLEVSYDDSSSLTARANVLSSANETLAFVVDAKGNKTPAGKLNDGDVAGESAVVVAGLPSVLLFELGQSYMVSTLRLFSGNLEYLNNRSGELAVTGYKVDVMSSASGQWREILNRSGLKGGKEAKVEDNESFFDVCDFDPLEITQLKITLLSSNDTGKRADPMAKPLPSAIIREVELYTQEAVANRATQLNSVLQSEYRLPVYRYQDMAQLYAILDPSVPEMQLEISIKERHNGKVPVPPVIVKIKAGENIIPIDIRNWENGEYRTTIRVWGKDSPVQGSFARLLRLNRVTDPAPTQAVENMTGRKMFFPDNWYLQKVENLEYKLELPEAHRVGRPLLKPDELVQLGTGIGFDKQDGLVVRFNAMNREWDSKSIVGRYARADLNNLDKWEIIEGKPENVDFTPAEIQKCGTRSGGSGSMGFSFDQGKFRFYDAAKDGPVPLDKLMVQYVGYKRVDWGVIKPTPQSTWLLWPKDGEYLILQDKPFLQDNISPEEFEDPTNSNDNFAGQWLSPDKKTFYYVRGRLLKRYPPFVARYDNLWQIARILTVFTTQDGLNWEQIYFGLPDEQDAPMAQHYGAGIYQVPGGNDLMLSYTYPYDAREQQYYVELYYSWGGRVWKRFPGHAPWIAPGKPGEWNFGTTTLHNNIVERGNNAYHLIGWGSMLPHFGGDFLYSSKLTAELDGKMLEKRYDKREMKKWPFFSHYGSYDKMAEELKSYGMTPGVMVYRTDGWFGLTAGAKSGTMVSRPIKAAGKMTVNLKAAHARFTLIDADGKAISGYDKTLSGMDSVNAVVFDTLPEQDFRVKAELKNGTLYNIGFGI